MTDIPELFSAQNYESCIHNENIYCKVTGKLFSISEINDVWLKLLKLNTNKHMLDRTLIHRGICLRQQNKSFYSITEESEQIINKKIAKYNLSANIVDFYCTDGNIPISTIDIIAMTAGITISSIIILSSIMYTRLESRKFLLADILHKFSLQHSWKRITTTSVNDDFEKLKSLQAIRVIINLLVILLHMKLFSLSLFWKNLDQLKMISENTFVQYNKIFDMFVVQIFLFISTFLLTNQIYKVFEREESFTLRDVFIILLNRFFRLGVVASVIVLISNTTLLRRMAPITALNAVTINEEACQKYWIPTVFLFNNFYYLKNMCNFISWSNSADFQMYAIVAMLLYLLLKFKIKEWVLMVPAVTVSIIIYGFIIFYFDLDVIYRPYLQDFEPTYFYISKSNLWSYTSTLSISTSSLCGMIFGTIYYRFKDSQINNTWTITSLWFLSSVGFPVIVILIANVEQHGIAATIIGPLLKPIFVVGTGCFILGTSHNIGGYLKKFTEAKFFVIFSNFTYCIYISNWLVTMTSNLNMALSKDVNILPMILDIILSVIKSCAVGIFLAFTIEQPGLAIQKLLLPQLNLDKKAEVAQKTKI